MIDLSVYDMKTLVNLVGMNLRNDYFIRISGRDVWFPELREMILKQKKGAQKKIRQQLCKAFKDNKSSTDIYCLFTKILNNLKV